MDGGKRQGGFFVHSFIHSFITFWVETEGEERHPFFSVFWGRFFWYGFFV
jgi:hypothetical protein